MPLVSVKSKPPSAAPPAQPSSTDEWQAVRVSIKVSARDPSLFVVRRLENGKAPPAGTRQALLVLLDPATDLGAVVSDEK